MPTYTYITNIPAATNIISQSQPQLQQNNNAINELININHVGFNVADVGKHNMVTMPLQVAAPVSAPTEGCIFNTASTSPTGIQEIWFTQPSTGLDYPITASILSTVAIPTFLQNGFGYLPSGIKMKWGRATGLVAGANTINLTTSVSGGPDLTELLNCQLTPISGAGSSIVFNSFNGFASPQTISVNVTGTSTACMYLLIGF